MEILRDVALVVCTIGCLLWDLRSRRIPNSWTYPAILAGIVLFSIEGRWLEPFLGILVGGGSLLGLALLVPGAMGMGDVKLGAAVGALGGGLFALNVVVYAFLLGGAFVLGKAILSGEIASVLSRSASLFLGIARGASVGRRVWVGTEGVNTVPFGVFLVIGSWAGLLCGGLL